MGSRLERLDPVLFETGTAFVKEGMSASTDSDNATVDLKRDFMISMFLLASCNC